MMMPTTRFCATALPPRGKRLPRSIVTVVSRVGNPRGPGERRALENRTAWDYLRASVTARVAFRADSPCARRLTSSVTLTEPLAFLSARWAALDGLSLTVLEPAPEQLTALVASVADFRPSCLRCLA